MLYGLLTAMGIALVVLGMLDMRASGRTGSAWLVLGLFPLLLAPIGLVHALRHVTAVRDMLSGRTAIARWAVPPAQFETFCEAERRIPVRSVLVNFYQPPRWMPADGIGVVFSDAGVMIGEGYFPLSRTGGRRVQGVQYLADPPAIEFTMALLGTVRTSSATYESTRAVHMLRIPVASDARREAGDVVQRYRAMIEHR